MKQPLTEIVQFLSGSPIFINLDRHTSCSRFINNMFGTIFSAGYHGLDATLIKVEVDVSPGLPGWQMVGLPEKTVQEAKERVGTALRNSGIHLEARKITINLAPTNHKKSGNQYDLPIAMGLLMAHQVLENASLSDFLFAGELSLTGELKPINGSLLFAMLAKQRGIRFLVLPQANAKEASLISDIKIVGCSSITEVIAFINSGQLPIRASQSQPQPSIISSPASPDLSEVKGQLMAKRALEIASAGGHHLLMMGPPGSGKTMLATRLPSILPPLTPDQSMETTKIYSALGLLTPEHPLITLPPIRTPHHSTSTAGLIGGGNGFLGPGEITLAHNGVLFLDELPEFHRDALQMLRQPVESGSILISRTKGRFKFPARFQLVAAMNPCRCGYLGHPKRTCVCAPAHVFQYRRKISGPLLDRIDLHVEVSPLTEQDLFENIPVETSAQILARVLKARELQKSRYDEIKISCNAQLHPKHLGRFCVLTDEAQKFFRKAFPSLNLSARAHDRILKVARTIADLAGSEKIATDPIAEAMQYRCLDREGYL